MAFQFNFLDDTNSSPILSPPHLPTQLPDIVEEIYPPTVACLSDTFSSQHMWGDFAMHKLLQGDDESETDLIHGVYEGMLCLCFPFRVLHLLSNCSARGEKGSGYLILFTPHMKFSIEGLGMFD
jgi:hypothetical protein